MGGREGTRGFPVEAGVSDVSSNMTSSMRGGEYSGFSIVLGGRKIEEGLTEDTKHAFGLEKLSYYIGRRLKFYQIPEPR